MRFKNYRNPYTNDNKIYSFKDLYDMPFGELIRRKQEVLGQYRVLGVPRDEELQSSENVVYVEAYTREDGTEVKAHYRSKPGGGSVNNTVTDDIKTEEPIQEKQESQPNENIQEHNQDNKEQTEQAKQETDERLYPEEIAGVKRGEPKTFDEIVNSGGVNPTYEQTIENNQDDGNCNSCVAAYLYNRRGYSVNAASTLDNEKAEELSHNGLDLWVEPKTGKVAEWTELDTEKVNSYDYLQKNMKIGEIYELAEYPQLVEGDPTTIEGHVVVVEKGENSQLKIYDPQKREPYVTDKKVKMYLDSWIDNPEAKGDIKPKVIRIDNKQINPYYESVLVP